MIPGIQSFILLKRRLQRLCHKIIWIRVAATLVADLQANEFAPTSLSKNANIIL
jgi:hypothetical protein